MRFFYPKPPQEERWHLWFAWHPVRIKPGDGTTGPWVWLEVLWRKEVWQGCWGHDWCTTYYDVLENHKLRDEEA